jgi:hypothetical protein
VDDAAPLHAGRRHGELTASENENTTLLTAYQMTASESQTFSTTR